MILGTSFRYTKSGRNRKLVEVNDTYQYVPLLKNLQWILNNPEIHNEVMKSVLICQLPSLAISYIL